MQRRLPVVQAALRNDADQRILIEIDWIVARRRHIATKVQDRPWPRPEERLTVHHGERRLDTRIGRVKRHQNLLGIGAPDDRQFLLSIHSLVSIPCMRRGAGYASAPCSLRTRYC